MNWDEIGAFAELIGATGVIASLVYLASQIRQNSKHIEASIYQSTNDVFVNWYANLANDPTLAKIWYEQIVGGEANADSEYQAEALISMFFLALENNYYHEKRGIVSRNTLKRPGFSRLFCSPIVSDWLEKHGTTNLTDEFLDVVNNIKKEYTKNCT